MKHTTINIGFFVLFFTVVGLQLYFMGKYEREMAIFYFLFVMFILGISIFIAAVCSPELWKGLKRFLEK